MIGINAVIMMGEGPPLALYRRDQQTTLRCFPGDRAVLNGIGKMSCWKDKVRIEKMNESEPPMRCRENEHPVKTQRSLMPGEECSGYLFTGYVAGVIEEA